VFCHVKEEKKKRITGRPDIGNTFWYS